MRLRLNSDTRRRLSTKVTKGTKSTKTFVIFVIFVSFVMNPWGRDLTQAAATTPAAYY
jgi:hypothetical protein